MRAGIKMSRERVEQTWGSGARVKENMQEMEGAEEERVMKIQRRRSRRGGMKTRDGHEEPGGQIMQKERLEGEMR